MRLIKKDKGDYNLVSKRIVQVGNKYRVESKKGRNMGEYSNEKEAQERLRQIEYFKKEDWMDTLKTVGAVTSTTAGIKTFPTYGKKKKKKKLLKAKLAKNTRRISIRNVTFEQKTPVPIEEIQKDFQNWESACDALRGKALGLSGGGTGKQRSLYDMVLRHGSAAREGRAAKTGMGPLLSQMMPIFDKSGGFTKDDEKILKGLKDKMLSVHKNNNPANMSFTGGASNPVKGENDKYKRSGEKVYYGHYRTPIYVAERKLIHEPRGKEFDGVKAVDSSWYSTQENTAKPPLWQAMFLGSSKDEGKKPKAVGNLKMGLLAIVERFADNLDDAEITRIEIRDTNDMKNKINDLLQIKPLMDEIEKVMNDVSSYKGNTGQVKYVGTGGVLTKINGVFLDAKDKNSMEYIEKISDLDEEYSGMDDIDEFRIILTKNTFNNLVNSKYRKEKNNKAPNGRRIILSTDTKRILDRYGIPQELRKSWSDYLWG